MGVLKFKQKEKNSGFAMNDRAIKKTAWYKNINARLLYLELSLSVTHSVHKTVFNNNEITLQPNQFVTTLGNLAKAIQGTKEQARNALNILEKHGVISKFCVGKQRNKCTIITLKSNTLNNTLNNTQSTHETQVKTIGTAKLAHTTNTRVNTRVNTIQQEQDTTIKEIIGETSSPQPSQDKKSSVKKIDEKINTHGEPKKPNANKINFDEIANDYHKILPDMPNVLLPLSDKRKNKIKTLSRKYGLTNERWKAYFSYVANNCQWMTEQRQDHNTGKVWRKKNLDYLIKEDCYITVKEQRANDY